MAKNNQNIVFPEEREGKIKDANKKLRAKVKQLNKQVKQLKEEKKQLERSFNKSHQFIEDKFLDKDVENVLRVIDNFDYKETERGRQRLEEEKQEHKRNFNSDECPSCGKNKEQGLKTLNFGDFRVQLCKCGHRKRVDQSEGISGS